MWTITDMTDNLGFGKEKRREGNLEILSGRVTFQCADLCLELAFFFFSNGVWK